jgi:galactose mutarotase-like enzyme
MTVIKEGLSIDGKPIVRMENDHLQVDVAPGVGGKVVSVFHKASGHEFVWHNVHLELELLPPHSEYDPNFYGGIDELLPNDIPETINGVECPDHGELWTLALDHRLDGEALVLTGTLPLFGLRYERRMALRAGGPYIDLDYRIENVAGQRREFLWKLHAALNIRPGDQIECPARTAQVPDLEWSRWRTVEPFDWPDVEGQRADLVPPKDGTMDFLYLYDLEAGRIALKSASKGLTFTYTFDTDVFPYTWLFASFGGFDGHYMAILEPCTTMPIAVNEAARLGQCSVLKPGEKIETRVTIYAGPAEA